MSTDPRDPPRSFTAPDGARWEARVVGRGAASPYLAAKVARPIVQFTRLDPPAGAPRYAPLPADELALLDEGALARLWGRARIH